MHDYKYKITVYKPLDLFLAICNKFDRNLQGLQNPCNRLGAQGVMLYELWMYPCLSFYICDGGVLS